MNPHNLGSDHAGRTNRVWITGKPELIGRDSQFLYFAESLPAGVIPPVLSGVEGSAPRLTGRVRDLLSFFVSGHDFSRAAS